MPPPPMPSIPPPARNGQATTRTGRKDFHVSSGVVAKAQKVIVYGAGGTGKTELCSLLGSCGIKTLIIDLEQGSHFLNVNRIDSVVTFDDLRDALHCDELTSQYGAIVVDSFTKAEELAEQWAIANIPHERGNKVSSLEDYGWGKGLSHVYDTFSLLLQDLDSLARNGKHVIGVAHECTGKVPNPISDDYIRFEPRLQCPASGKNSIRNRCVEWCDHLLFVSFDIAVSKDGKAQGIGGRTIYTQEFPSFMAKSRSLAQPIVYQKGSPAVWQAILK